MTNVWKMSTHEVRAELKTCIDPERRNALYHYLFIMEHDDGGFY